MADFKPVVIVFSKSKYGKTIDCVSSLPKAAFIADKNALLSAKTVIDHVPTNVPTARTFQDVTGIITSGVLDKYDALCVDDVTLLSRDTERFIRENESTAKGQNAWNFVVDAALAMLQAAKDCGKVVVINGHERLARTNNAGKYIRGGIDLSCDLTEAFTARVDGAFRGIKCEDDDVLKPMHAHAFLYRSPAMDESWATGNRINAPDTAPANIGELLRATGVYDPPRPEKLKWQVDVINQIFEKLKTTDKQEVLTKAFAQLKTKFHLPHVLWALRDAEDRHTIWKFNQEKHSQYDPK